jgi:hypothetical protein
MKTNQKLIKEFSIDELENRLEMEPWVRLVPCTDPSHCHPPQQ